MVGQSKQTKHNSGSGSHCDLIGNIVEILLHPYPSRGFKL